MTTKSDPAPFLTIVEAAALLRVGRTVAYQQARQYLATGGREGLPVVRLGRQLRLCALTGRYDEAHAWFAEARRTLADQGVRSLLAVCDHDEALMLARRRGPGDTAAAGPLLESARGQFEELGMTGWLRRADDLARRIGGEGGP